MHIEHSAVEIHKCWTNCLTPLRMDPQDITESMEMFQLNCFCCSNIAQTISFACCIYVVYLIFFSLRKWLWLSFHGGTVYETQSFQYIPYPSPPATSTPDSFWSWICVWRNAMDKLFNRFKSLPPTVPLKTLRRLTQSPVNTGFVKVFHGKCRCKIKARVDNVEQLARVHYILKIWVFVWVLNKGFSLSFKSKTSALLLTKQISFIEIITNCIPHTSIHVIMNPTAFFAKTCPA